MFPGFDNLIDTDGDGFGDQVINAAKNSGRPDAKIGSSTDGEFLEYQFTADDLSEFTGFVIKVVFSGTCLLYTSPSPRDATLSRMPSSA